jgi:hypothetical protein
VYPNALDRPKKNRARRYSIADVFSLFDFFSRKKRSVLQRAIEHKRALFLHECIDFV